MKLRDYQQRCHDNAIDAFQESRSTLVVLPTGCVASDSVIGLNRGGKGYSRTIERAYEATRDPRRIGSIPAMIRSHVGGRIGLNHAKEILYSGKKKTCELRLSNGKRLRATPDHEILTEHGYAPMGDLVEGVTQVVCEADVQARGGRKPKPQYRVIQGLKHHPYAQGVCSRSRKGRKPEGRLYRVPTHRLVAEANINGIGLDDLVKICRHSPEYAAHMEFIDPSTHAVHHIDGDHLNNCISNLAVMTHSAHHVLHGSTNKLANLGKGLIETSTVLHVRSWGIEDTYDVICADPHRNFVANGIVVHNCGKTVVFSHVADTMGPRGRILVIAHREELVMQAAAKLEAVTGHKPEIEMADRAANESTFFGQSQIVVASVQTLNASNQSRLKKFNPDTFSLVVTDEAHHATAVTYRRVYDYFHQNQSLKHLGVTATPDRADEEALGQVFDSVAFDYEISDAVKDGWLVPINQRSVEVASLDYSNVKTTAGDLNQKDLAAVLEYEKNLHEIARPTVELTAGRKTLVFAASVAHAERLSEIFNRHQAGMARWVCGETPKDQRREILRSYSAGQFSMLVNVGVFTEGFDEPGVECVALARPTKSRALFAQMVGRGTRPLPGIVDPHEHAEDRREAIALSAKPCLDVIDFVGNSGKHKLMSCADILGGKYSDEIVERAKSMTRKDGEPVDVEQALFEAEKEIHEEHKRAEEEAKRRAHIKADVSYKVKGVDPFNVLDIEPHRERGWDKNKPPSQKQVDFLRRKGIELPEGATKAAASQLCGEVIDRMDRGQCTFKQAKLLQRYGLPTDIPMSEARRMIDEIAANGWRRPENMKQPEQSLEDVAAW